MNDISYSFLSRPIKINNKQVNTEKTNIFFIAKQNKHT